MICDTTCAETFATKFAYRPRKIGVQRGCDIVFDERMTVFRTENDMHEIEAQRLRHGRDYMSGLQPSENF